MPPLPARLAPVYRWAREYGTVADVGASGGALCGALAEAGIRVLPSERTAGGAEVLRQRLGPAWRVRVGDGLMPFRDERLEAAVIAGMGSGTVVHILGQRHVLATSPAFLLQPMQGLHLLLQYLRGQGASIEAGALARDGNRIYPALKVRLAEVKPAPTVALEPEDFAGVGYFEADPLWSLWLTETAEALARRTSRDPHLAKVLEHARQFCLQKLQEMSGTRTK